MVHLLETSSKQRWEMEGKCECAVFLMSNMNVAQHARKSNIREALKVDDMQRNPTGKRRDVSWVECCVSICSRAVLVQRVKLQTEISDCLHCQSQWKAAHTFDSQAQAVDFGFLWREAKDRH